jgi:hypothetical protein
MVVDRPCPACRRSIAPSQFNPALTVCFVHFRMQSRFTLLLELLQMPTRRLIEEISNFLSASAAGEIRNKCHIHGHAISSSHRLDMRTPSGRNRTARELGQVKELGSTLAKRLSPELHALPERRLGLVILGGFRGNRNTCGWLQVSDRGLNQSTTARRSIDGIDAVAVDT